MPFLLRLPYFKTLFYTFLLGLPSFLLADTPLRQDLNINREWKFKIGDHPGANAPQFEDSTWDNINLPHSFSLPYFQDMNFYTGYGWYRKHLDIKPEWASKKVFLEFAGAFQDAEIYVNGTRIGEHKGGYTGFSMDITSAIHVGDNVLAVRLNNLWNARIAPRGGDHNFIGGIYRDVHLVVTDPLHVTWYGTFVTTPAVSKDSATVNVKTEIQNQDGKDRVCTVETTLLDPNGKSVAVFSSTLPVKAGTTVIFNQTSPALSKPKLWHPDHPFLYTAVTKVSSGKEAVDDFQTTFGFRWIKWTADQGFFINGEHLFFHGANVHQDHAGWGNATTQTDSYRDVKMVKDAGFDFIRGSHYPHHPAFAAACDKIGVLFWSENCFWAAGGGQKEGSWIASAYPPNPEDQAPFEENVLETLRDHIRIFRNHPSIVVWSMSNEPFFTAKPEMPKTRELLSREVALAHQLDPTRLTAIGGAQRGEIDKLGDIAGYNGDGSRLYMNPGIPNVVSEYGSYKSDRPSIYDGQFKAKEIQDNTPEYAWRSGQVIWCAFDYGTIFGRPAGSMGIVDYFRIPKRSWYWYRNKYLHIPPPEWPQNGTPAKLSLTADKTTITGTDAIDDCHLLVTVQDKNGKPVSNTPPVTLTIESGPGEFPTGRSITFDPNSDIAIRDGQAAIEFRSYQGGKSVIRATSQGLEGSSITILTTGEPQFTEQTPLLVNRPYTPFVNSDVSQEKKVKAQNVAVNRPCNSNSEDPGHTAGLATDGNPATFWQSANDHSGAWWQVDLEHPYAIDSIETDLGSPANFQYKVEGSNDGKIWKLLVDQTKTTSTDKIRTDTFPKNSQSQFLRLTFTGLPMGKPAVIAEAKIIGKEIR